VTRTIPALTVIVLATTTACAATSTEQADRPRVPSAQSLPAIAQPSSTGEIDTSAKSQSAPAAMAVVDIDGQLGIVDGSGAVSDAWIKWSALVAPDNSQAVLTLPPDTARTLSSTEVSWVSLPAGKKVGELTVEGIVTEATATSLDGEFVALTTLADKPVDGAIAGGRDGTNVLIASRSSGLLYETSLPGNFMAEAFSQRLTAAGIPAQVFLLEYLPADAPSYYQVRVLSTETGRISPPLNLRDKTETLDQQMAGYSRSHVVANDHGLLFTLYIGTDDSDETHPHAFVHTLDFADGVWCLDIDPKLDLTNVAGSLAVGGDRLYVASANGWVGSFLIPSITDPDQSPAMDWTAQVAPPGSAAPAISADDDGVYVATGNDKSQLVHLRPDGTPVDPIDLPGPEPQAVAVAPNGDVIAVGDNWTTLTGELHRPEWLDDIRQLIIAPTPTK
jgi:hypothetical protein